MAKMKNNKPKVRTKENYKKMRGILLSGIALFILYSGLRFVESLFITGDFLIGGLALAGGFVLSLFFIAFYFIISQPTLRKAH